jgi:hypothetical protein
VIYVSAMDGAEAWLGSGTRLHAGSRVPNASRGTATSTTTVRAARDSRMCDLGFRVDLIGLEPRTGGSSSDRQGVDEVEVMGRYSNPDNVSR